MVPLLFQMEQQWKIEVSLERLEEVMAKAITWANEQQEAPPAGEMLATLMEALYLQKDALVKEHQKKINARAQITIEEVEEGEAAPSPGTPRSVGAEERPAPPPRGPVPATGPRVVPTANASAQTPEEWATPADAAAIAAAGRPARGTETLEERWAFMEAQLRRAQRATRQARRQEEELLGQAEEFFRGGPRAQEFVGVWPGRISRRRELWAAWDKAVQEQKEREVLQKDLQKTREEARTLERQLAEIHRREAETLRKLEHPVQPTPADREEPQLRRSSGLHMKKGTRRNKKEQLCA